MKFELEVTGGFTGKAGKELIRIDTDQLEPEVAERLHRDLEQLPPQTWGHSFLAPHPKPWDFLHELRVIEDGRDKSVRFHPNYGPPELTRITEQLKELDASDDQDALSQPGG